MNSEDDSQPSLHEQPEFGVAAVITVVGLVTTLAVLSLSFVIGTHRWMAVFPAFFAIGFLAMVKEALAHVASRR